MQHIPCLLRITQDFMDGPWQRTAQWCNTTPAVPYFPPTRPPSFAPYTLKSDNSS